MQEADVAAAMRDMFIVVLKVGGPPLLGALVIGLLVSLVQAVTQINESTLAFVPKVLGIGAMFAMIGPFMYATLYDYSRHLFDMLITVGGR